MCQLTPPPPSPTHESLLLLECTHGNFLCESSLTAVETLACKHAFLSYEFYSTKMTVFLTLELFEAFPARENDLKIHLRLYIKLVMRDMLPLLPLD